MQLNVQDVAKLLRTTEKQVYTWVDEGEIPFEMTNEQPWFNRSELLEWATERRLPISSGVFRRLGTDLGSIPSLALAIARGGVHRIDAHEPADVLRQVVAAMPVSSEDDRESIFQVLVAREGKGMTAIGDGIAIPHVLAPAVVPDAPTSVTLCYLEQPLDIAAPDGRPIHVVFSIVSASISGHLELLAHLAAALHAPGFKAALVRHAELKELEAEMHAAGVDAH